MANICSFSIMVNALIPEAKDCLHSLAEALESSATASRYPVDHPDPKLAGTVDEYIVELAAVLNDQSFWWVKSLPIMAIDGNRAAINGECKWNPPVKFIASMSEKYPYLEFRLEGSTSCERFEQWIAIRGRVSRLEYMLYDRDEVFEWEVLGDTISPEEIMDDDGWFHIIEQRALSIIGSG